VEAALTAPTQASAPDFARRVGIIVATLREVVGLGFLDQPHLLRFGAPLWARLSRILERFQGLMDRLAAGRWPRQRRGPHTGGAPHPENLHRGDPWPTNPGWLMIVLGWERAGCRAQLEALLAEPAAAEILARVPAAERILRPLRRMLGLGRPRTVDAMGQATRMRHHRRYVQSVRWSTPWQSLMTSAGPSSPWSRIAR